MANRATRTHKQMYTHTAGLLGAAKSSPFPLRRGRTGPDRRRGETPRESLIGALPGPHKAPGILAHTPEESLGDVQL